jgi:hypothetical protein
VPIVLAIWVENIANNDFQSRKNSRNAFLAMAKAWKSRQIRLHSGLLTFRDATPWKARKTVAFVPLQDRPVQVGTKRNDIRETYAGNTLSTVQ